MCTQGPPKKRGVLWPPPPISWSPHTDTIFHCVHLTRPESNKKGLSAAPSLAILLSAWPSSHTHKCTHSLPISVKHSRRTLSIADTLTHTCTRKLGNECYGGLISVLRGLATTSQTDSDPRAEATEKNLCDRSADEQRLCAVQGLLYRSSRLQGTLTMHILYVHTAQRQAVVTTTRKKVKSQICKQLRVCLLIVKKKEAWHFAILYT